MRRVDAKQLQLEADIRVALRKHTNLTITQAETLADEIVSAIADSGALDGAPEREAHAPEAGAALPEDSDTVGVTFGSGSDRYPGTIVWVSNIGQPPPNRKRGRK